MRVDVDTNGNEVLTVNGCATVGTPTAATHAATKGYVDTATPANHATRHQHGGADEVATATAAANAIPKADGGGKLDGWISDAAASVKGKLQLATDLGGSAAAPQVVGLKGNALPSNLADGFIKRNSGNSAWEEVAYGTAANTVAQGNDARFPAYVDAVQRVLSSLLPNVATALTLLSGTAYFVYLGRTVVAFTPKYVEFYVNTAGAGAQTAEAGLFSSTNPPNKGSPSLSKLVSTGTLDSLTTTGLKRNSSAFSTSVAAGTHLWAGIRTAMATTQPALSGLCMDFSEGRVLSTASAGALTGAGPWTGAIIAIPSYLNTAIAPDLRVTLD